MQRRINFETAAAATRTVPGLGAPLASLAFGALATASSPLFVRLAEVGPFASAFWRVAGALPLLWLWAAYEARRAAVPVSAAFRIDRTILLAGALFAGDLLFWHLAILNTTIANATLFANMTPVWLLLGSGLIIGERVTRTGILGILIALAGAALLIGSSYSFAPDRLEGDLYAIVTSVFYAAYFMAVRVARRTGGSGRIVFLSSMTAAPILLAAASVAGNDLSPATWAGAGSLAALALYSHAGGQGMLAFALGHLPAAFASLVTLFGALFAAALAWIVLGEAMAPVQIAGGVLILSGIYVARPREGRP